jgi:hypothetical protein
MATTHRDPLSTELHRLANHCECKLCDFLVELLSDGRTEAVQSLAWAGTRFIESLRTIRDGKEKEGE